MVPARLSQSFILRRRIAPSNDRSSATVFETHANCRTRLTTSTNLKPNNEQAALDMTLTGKNIRPDKAKKMGLADIVCDPAALEAVALDTAKQLAAGTLKVG